MVILICNPNTQILFQSTYEGHCCWPVEYKLASTPKMGSSSQQTQPSHYHSQNQLLEEASALYTDCGLALNKHILEMEAVEIWVPGSFMQQPIDNLELCRTGKLSANDMSVEFEGRSVQKYLAVFVSLAEVLRLKLQNIYNDLVDIEANFFNYSDIMYNELAIPLLQTDGLLVTPLYLYMDSIPQPTLDTIIHPACSNTTYSLFNGVDFSNFGKLVSQYCPRSRCRTCQ